MAPWPRALAKAVAGGASRRSIQARGEQPVRLRPQSQAAIVSAQSSDRIGFPLDIGYRNVAAIIAERGTTMTVGEKGDRAQTDGGEHDRACR
jgi:hypothetical protein